MGDEGGHRQQRVKMALEVRCQNGASAKTEAILRGVIKAAPKAAWRLVAEFANGAAAAAAEAAPGGRGVTADIEAISRGVISAADCQAYLGGLRRTAVRPQELAAVVHRWPNDNLKKTMPPTPSANSKLECDAWQLTDGSLLLQVVCTQSNTKSLVYVPAATVEELAPGVPLPAARLDAVFTALIAGVQRCARRRVTGFTLNGSNGTTGSFVFEINPGRSDPGNWVREAAAAAAARAAVAAHEAAGD